MKIAFTTQPKDGATGASFGYGLHTKKVHEGLQKMGVVSQSLKEADWFLAINNTHGSKPYYGLRNVLFSMVETDPPNAWGEGIYGFDLLLTPCQFSKQAMQRMYYGPIEVVPEGIDSERFPFHQHQPPAPGEKFRFLWVGNDHDKRKGGHIAKDAFKAWVASGAAPANVELYFKTSAAEDYPPGISTDGPVTIDARHISAAELRDLYDTAHCFLFPSIGEGWGLSLTEAMAVGLPCISSMNTAMLDYFDESVGYCLTDFDRYRWALPNCPAGAGWAPKPAALIAAMEAVMGDYDEALRRAKKASDRMHTQYTWEQANAKLVAALEKHANDQPMTPRTRCPDLLYEMYKKHGRTWVFEKQHLAPGTTAKQVRKMIAKQRKGGK